MTSIVASAPGKLVLLGEYAVLEGAPAGENGFLVRLAGSPHLYRMAPSVAGRLFLAPSGKAG